MSQTLSDATAHLDALLGLPEIHNALPSPDGRWVAWTWAGLAPTTDVYTARTDGADAPVRLTASDQNAWAVSWTSDSSAVLVAQDKDGDERVQLFRVDLDRPRHMQPLTEPEPNYYIQGGQLHPNGRWLVYSANVNEAGNEIEATWLYRHDLTSGERLVLARPSGASWAPPRLSPQGAHVLYRRKDLHPAGEQLWLVGINGEDDREIVNVGATRKATGVWYPDGAHILVHAEADTHFRVGAWSLRDSSLRWLIDDPARNIEDIAFPRNSRMAILYDVRATRIHPSLLDVQTNREASLPTLSGVTNYPLAPTPDGGWTSLTYSSQQIDDITRVTPDDTHVSLARVWEQTPLRANHLVPAEEFRWRADDGLGIQGWLYRASRPPRGTIIYVHGGPTWLYEDRVNIEVQFFAAQGFNVLAPNYRGSTGFSRPYQEAIKAEGWGGSEQADIRAGIEALIAAGIAQPGRIGITGTSYGGYSSWCAITRFPPDLIAAAAPVCGMTDLVVDYETTRPDLRPYSAEMMGGTPQEVPDRFYNNSPIHFVGNIRGRLLIVQGEQDPNVTPENVTVVRQALDAAGIEYEVLTFPDEGHGIVRRPNLRTLLLRLADFFAEAFA